MLGRHVRRASDVKVVGAREIITARDDHRAEIGESVGGTATGEARSDLHAFGCAALSRPPDKKIIALPRDRGVNRNGVEQHPHRCPSRADSWMFS